MLPSVKVTRFDGITYEGEMSGSRPHGKGKLTDAKGKISEGWWENGKLMKHEKLSNLTDHNNNTQKATNHVDSMQERTKEGPKSGFFSLF